MHQLIEFYLIFFITAQTVKRFIIESQVSILDVLLSISKSEKNSLAFSDVKLIYS